MRIVRLTLQWTLVIFLSFILLLSPASLAQQSPESENKAVNQYSKGGAVTSRRPGTWVQRALAGPQITQTQEEADEPTRLQQVYIDILNALFLGLNGLISEVLPFLLRGDEGPAGVGELVITEIAQDGTNTFIEIYNPRAIRVPLDNWALCKVSGCTAATELAGRVLERDDIIVLQLGGVFDSSLANGVVTLQVGSPLDDIGLYDFSGASERDQEDEVAIVDYVQWGNTSFQSFGLEPVAVSAGLWTRLTAISDTLLNHSFQLRSNRLQSGGSANDYVVVPFSQNSLGELTSANLETSPTTQPTAAKTQ